MDNNKLTVLRRFVFAILIALNTYVIFHSDNIEARTIRIAVLDTGLNNINGTIPICPESKDFTLRDSNIKFKDFKKIVPLNDENGHGTNISNIIHQIAKDTDYCQIILKVFAFKKGINGEKHTSEALEYIDKLFQPVDFINYSAGGTFVIPKEKILIQKLIDKGVTFISAAGNNNKNLDEDCNYYPACYDNKIIVVGNINNDGSKNSSSNYGIKVIKFWANGVNRTAGQITLTGTSQATAIVSGQMIVVMDRTYNKRVTQSNEAEMVTKSAEAFYIQTGLRSYMDDLYKRKINKNTAIIIEKLIPLSNMVIQRKFVIEKSF